MEKLLRETDERVADVGLRVGYDVVRTFTRTFTRLRGTSPRELRRGTPAASSATPEPDDDSPRALAARWRRRLTVGRADAGRC